MFGEMNMDEIQSIYVEAYYHGREVPNRMTIKRPNLFRNVLSSDVLVFDGERAAYAKRGPDNQGNPRHPEMIEAAFWKHFEVDIALVFPAFFDYPTELEGIEKVKGEDAFKLYVKLPLGATMTYFVDATTFLITKRQASWDGNPEDIWENFITGYTEYHGMLFASEFSFEGREGIEKAYYKNVAFNIDPKDELFQIPDEVVRSNDK